MSKEGCYDDTVKGELLTHCWVRQLTRNKVGMLAGPTLADLSPAGVAHVASIMMGGSPQEGIPLVVAGGLNTLKSAAKEPSVACFVYTSSSTAATLAKPNAALAIDETTYNEEAIRKAWNFLDGEDESFKGMYIYRASKAQTEQEMWKWVKDNKPGFAFNAVVGTIAYLFGELCRALNSIDPSPCLSCRLHAAFSICLLKHQY